MENSLSKWVKGVVCNDIFRIGNMLCGIFNKCNWELGHFVGLLDNRTDAQIPDRISDHKTHILRFKERYWNCLYIFQSYL